jgi:hypothetical protein
VPEWLVRLDGDAYDLRVLCEHLSSVDPNVRSWTRCSPASTY